MNIEEIKSKLSMAKDLRDEASLLLARANEAEESISVENVVPNYVCPNFDYGNSLGNAIHFAADALSFYVQNTQMEDSSHVRDVLLLLDTVSTKHDVKINKIISALKVAKTLTSQIDGMRWLDHAGKDHAFNTSSVSSQLKEALAALGETT